MFEGYKLSSELVPGMIEVVVEQYDEGKSERLYQMLVPRSRVSKASIGSILTSLICRFNGKSGLGFESIVHSYLNSRGKEPPAYDPFQMKVVYPEPGVLRTYCGTNTLAWVDEIVSPDRFRREAVS